MTNARQIKQLVKPLLVRNPDLALMRSCVLWMVPIRHVGRTIVIDGWRDKNRFEVRWFLRELYRPDEELMRGFGRADTTYRRSSYLPNTESCQFWDWNDPCLPEAFLHCIEDDVLPDMRPVISVPDAIDYLRASENRLQYYGWTWRLIGAIAMGDLDAAREIWQPHASMYVTGKTVADHAQRTYDRFCSIDAPLMAGDRAALAQLLHTWEAENVRGTRLAPHWEASPFPIDSA